MQLMPLESLLEAKKRETFIRRERDNGRFIFLPSNKCVCKNALYFTSIRISMYRVGDKIILLNLGCVSQRTHAQLRDIHSLPRHTFTYHMEELTGTLLYKYLEVASYNK